MGLQEAYDLSDVQRLYVIMAPTSRKGLLEHLTPCPQVIIGTTLTGDFAGLGWAYRRRMTCQMCSAST